MNRHSHHRRGITGKARRLQARPRLELLDDRVLLSVNPIVAENLLPGTPSSQWAISGAGDSTIQGFSTDISVDHGQSIGFKINDSANVAYRIDIYRMGYYQGNGARLVTTLSGSQVLDQVQPAPLKDNNTELVDAGNWAVSATWAVPSTATSGIYFARVARNDTGGASDIFFIVRNDTGTSDILFQTSDSTWQAYNTWGGSSLYQGGTYASGGGVAVSYNRPLTLDNVSGGFGDFNSPLHAEYPMVRWMEQNGYDVSYFTDVDSARNGNLILNHKVFMDAGHDEYWSGPQFNNIMAARDAGVNLAFFSGNESFWKTRWQSSTDASATPYRTVVTYKESKNGLIDPLSAAPNNIWTGTWRDPNGGAPLDGARPENSLAGTMYMNDRTTNDLGIPLTVPYADSQFDFWRNTSVASLQPGQTATLGQYIVGYETDEDVNNGSRPAGLIDLSSTTFTTASHVLDPTGTQVGPGTSTHSITMYRAASGALVFGAGTVQWSWGLDGNHNNVATTPDVSIQQATINLFTDMNVQPTTIQAGLVFSRPSTNIVAPTTTISTPTAGANFTAGVPVTITGTATAASGSMVAGVEVSTDGGHTWYAATGRTSWSYTWTPPATGPVVITSRAADDGNNVGAPSAGVSVMVTLAPTSATGLVADYNFDEGSGTIVHDLSGNGNTGTLSNVAWAASGHSSGGLSFNGTNSYVSINDSASLHLTTGMTLEAWVDPSNATNSNPVIIKEGTGVAPYSLYSADTTTPVSYLTTNTSGSISAATASNALATNTWSHLAATYDGSTLTLYVNGVVVNSAAVSASSMITSTGKLKIGGDSVFANEFFQGLIDDVRIYNRPLSVSEIQADMSTPAGGALEKVAPVVSLTGPQNNSVVTGTATLTANASDNVALAGVQFLLNGAPLGAENLVAPFVLGWDTTKALNGSYVISARARDMAGNSTISGSVTVTVKNPPDTIAPTVRVLDPSNNATVGGKLVVSAFATDNIGVAGVQFQVNGVNLGAEATTAPFRAVWDASTYASGTYTVTAVARDAGGNMTTSTPLTVTVDSTPPTLTARTPAPGASSVTTDSAVVMTFSKPIQLSTASVVVSGPAGVVPGSLSYDNTTNTLTFAHSSALSPLTTYTVAASGAKDLYGNTMAPLSWSFTTVNAITGASLWGASVTPSVASANDASAVEMGVQFSSSTGGYITGLRFYKGSSNTGTHVGHLWTSGGTLLATATFSSETATGWQQVSFASPVPIAANTTYVASYFAPAGGYAINSNYFSTTYSNAPLHAPVAAGVYFYGSSGGFPTNSYLNGNYWVDVLYSSNALDTSAPTVTSTTPATNATATAVNSAVSAIFNKPVQAGTVAFTLTGPGGAVPASLSYNNSTYTATLAPNSDLATSTTYTASLSGATDQSGNVMAPYSWSFTTSSTSTIINASLWNSTTTPAAASVNDSNAVELGVKFTSDTAGYITGLRFYKGAANTGTHVAHLWSSTGALLATATFSNETGTGWQQANFAAPVAIAANTTYVASYFAPSGGYASDQGYFASGYNNAPLHTPANAGVYVYGGNGGFPTSSWNNGNYWVDVAFSTTSADTTPPTITNSSPAANATGVSIASSVAVNFNKSVQPATIVFTLSGPGGIVASTISYNNDTNGFTLIPSNPLATSTVYTASVSGTKDLSGNVMAPVTWSFTTSSSSISTLSFWTTSTLPALASANDTSAVEVGVRFTSDTAGSITGLRFYKGASNTGTHVGHLWSSTGTLLATATFTGESATGWQQVNFATPVTIAANTTYTASYFAPVGEYAVSSAYFGSGYDNAPLHAPANAGVYVYGSSGGFPTGTYNSGNYWVDVLFAKSTNITPKVSSTTPTSNATGVALNSVLTASFNEPMKSATTVFTLTGPSGAVPATLSFNGANDVATLTPTSPLSALANYTASVSGSTDLNGLVIAPLSWTFTTAADSLFTPSAVPALASANDTSAVEVGVRFTLLIVLTASK